MFTILPYKAKIEFANTISRRMLAGESPREGWTWYADQLVRASRYDSEAKPVAMAAIHTIVTMARKRHAAAVARFDRGAADFAAKLMA